MTTAPRKILVIKLRAMGDTVLLTAPLAELRRAYPDAQIDVLVPRSWAPLLEGHSAVNRVIPYERGSPASLGVWALKLRRERYDCVLNFHASSSSALLARATGAARRSVHFHGHEAPNRFSTVEVPGKGLLKPAIERDMDVLRALDLHVPPGRMPRIELQSTEENDAAQRLKRLGLSAPVLALGLGASRPTKSWPVERFAGLAVAWTRKTGGGTIALTGPGETALSQEFLKQVDEDLLASIEDQTERARIRRLVAVEPALELRAMAAMLGQCQVFAGNDSGPKHVAVATGTPTVTLFGPEHPFEWHPYPTDLHPYFFVEGLACRRDAAPGKPPWCGLRTCVEEQHRCMREIGINPVLEACLRVSRRS